ncbi:hypothetical protein K4F52_008565 [Lecanicillium sp. MT-2017a]|nr:hypothetical protein K4F52_008565 [Lecanicillium sp. MT-2017a]
MKVSGIFSAILVASATTVSAAPLADMAEDKRELNFGGLGPLSGLAGMAGPLGGVASALQMAVAEVFKLGDGVLNLPGDAAEKIAKGDPAGALIGALQNGGTLAGELPEDFFKILGAIAGGGGKKQ